MNNGKCDMHTRCIASTNHYGICDGTKATMQCYEPPKMDDANRSTNQRHLSEIQLKLAELNSAISMYISDQTAPRFLEMTKASVELNEASAFLSQANAKISNSLVNDTMSSINSDHSE